MYFWGLDIVVEKVFAKNGEIAPAVLIINHLSHFKIEKYSLNTPVNREIYCHWGRMAFDLVCEIMNFLFHFVSVKLLYLHRYE